MGSTFQTLGLHQVVAFNLNVILYNQNSENKTNRIKHISVSHIVWLCII